MITGTIKKKIRAIHSRILLNRITAAFFVFSFILCLTQAVIQSLLFSVDSEYKGLLYEIISTVEPNALLNLTEIPSQFRTNNIQLRLCNSVSIGADRKQNNCSIVFDTNLPIDPPSPVTVMEEIAFFEHGVSVRGDNTAVSVGVGQTCAQTLLYAHQNIRNFSSEDLTFILLQFWLLGISVLTVMNDSVPHLCTVFMTRVLMTAWSIYSLWRTHNFQVIFGKLYAEPGTPCHIDFFAPYFPRRMAYEISDLVLSATGLVIACWFSWGLLQTYNAQAVRYVGAPEHINRINKLSLAVLSCLQMEIFILVAAMGLWVDVLKNTAINRISSHNTAYLGLTITTSIVLIPWICLGWYGIRREMKKTIALFFFFAFVIISGWSLMFYSLVYRWTFLQWPFLAGLSVSSFILIASSTILAIICRLNFDRGLKQYLEAEAALAKSGFSPEVFRHDEEKNTPLDLSTTDFKMSTFSPTSPAMKYEQPAPTNLAQLPYNRSGSMGVGAHYGPEGRVAAQRAPLQVPRLAERPTRMSRSPPTYNVQFGESF